MSKTPDEHTNKIKKTIEDIIGADTTLKFKRKTKEDKSREKFILVLKTLEEVETRSFLLEEDFKLGFSLYDEKFYTIIDNLIELCWGKEASDVIDFYIRGRFNADGTLNTLADESGNEVPLNTPSDVWDLITFLKERNTKK